MKPGECTDRLYDGAADVDPRETVAGYEGAARWAARCDGDVGGVGAGAVDQGGLAAAQERQADHVEAGARGDDAAVVADAALAVEHRHVTEAGEEAEVGAGGRWPR